MRYAARVALSTSVLILTFGCARQQSQPAISSADSGVESTNALLRELAHEDQASRRGQSFSRTDADRVKLVLAELAKSSVRTPEDKANAALVLQHTGMTFCGDKLVSLSADNYLLAHHLASAALDAGHEPARFLVAQTIDRYLSMTEGIQKFGTNRFINQETGAEEWTPIDRNTTDAERAKYGVPPLAQLLKQFQEQKKKEKP
jgi:hypothetical protein